MSLGSLEETGSAQDVESRPKYETVCDLEVHRAWKIAPTH